MKSNSVENGYYFFQSTRSYQVKSNDFFCVFQFERYVRFFFLIFQRKQEESIKINH